MIKILLIIISLLPISVISANAISEILMTVDGEEIQSSEFEYLYHKNQNQQLDPISFDEYLELFKIYRLKIADARHAGIDTTKTFRKEISQYKGELLLPYLNEETSDKSEEVSKKIKIDYDRLRTKFGSNLSKQQLLRKEEAWLYINNPEYRNLIKEYIDGSMLYEISLRKVWEPGMNDTVGLSEFFKKNRSNYEWDSPRIKCILVQATSDSIAEIIKQKTNLLSSDSIIAFVRKNFPQEAYAEKVLKSAGENDMIDFLFFDGNKSEPKIKGWKVFFALNSRILNVPEEFSDVKDLVSTDFQIELENKWIEDLKRKYKIEINESELKSIKEKVSSP